MHEGSIFMNATAIVTELARRIEELEVRLNENNQKQDEYQLELEEAIQDLGRRITSFRRAHPDAHASQPQES